MPLHSRALRFLAEDLLGHDILRDLDALAHAQPIQLNQLVGLDRRLGGPSIDTLNGDGSGQYEIADRDVFRPLQYCAMFFRNGVKNGDLDWHARDIVEMSGLHIEALVKRIGRLFGLPLGALLFKPRVQRRLDPVTLERLRAFTRFYNEAKHNLSHEKDTHLFSIEDAFTAYFVSRKLGLSLYPLARLDTDLSVFE